ncbi:hypothetical protein [Streptomyces sp. CB03234]|nr:hypothetical protein [Streptomyces sp. CB03234]
MIITIAVACAALFVGLVAHWFTRGRIEATGTEPWTVRDFIAPPRP